MPTTYTHRLSALLSDVEHVLRDLTADTDYATEHTRYLLLTALAAAYVYMGEALDAAGDLETLRVLAAQLRERPPAQAPTTEEALDMAEVERLEAEARMFRPIGPVVGFDVNRVAKIMQELEEEEEEELADLPPRPRPGYRGESPR